MSGPQGCYVITCCADEDYPELGRKYRKDALNVLKFNHTTPEDVINIISRGGLIGYHSLLGEDRTSWLFYSGGHHTSLVAWSPDRYPKIDDSSDPDIGDCWILIYKKSIQSTLAYASLIKTYPVQNQVQNESTKP